MDRFELRPRNLGAWLFAALVLLIVLGIASAGETGALVFAAVVTVVTLVIVIARSRRRIIVDETGITQKGIQRKQVTWDRVAGYTYWTANGLDAAARAKPSDRLFAAIKLVDADGKKLTIDSKWRRSYPAVEYAIEQVHARLHTTGFEPFTFFEGALGHSKRGRIAYADIDKVVVTADQLSIRQRGKTLEWAGVEFKRLANTLLFLERLMETGVNVIVTGGQFIPPAVMERLRAARDRAVTRQSNL